MMWPLAEVVSAGLQHITLQAVTLNGVPQSSSWTSAASQFQRDTIGWARTAFRKEAAMRQQGRHVHITFRGIATYWEPKMRMIFDRAGTISEILPVKLRAPEVDQRRQMLLSAATRLHAAFAKRSEHCALAVLDEDGVVISWYDQLFGAACIGDGVLYQHVSQFYMARDVAVLARSLRCAADCGADIQEGWRRRPGGAIYWGTTAIEAVVDGEGRTLGFAHITRRAQGPWEVTPLAMTGPRQARQTPTSRHRLHLARAPAQAAL